MARLDAIGMTKLKIYLKLKTKMKERKNLNDWFENKFKLEDVIWSLNLNKYVLYKNIFSWIFLIIAWDTKEQITRYVIIDNWNFKILIYLRKK